MSSIDTMPPQTVIDRLRDLIRKAPAGGPFHHATATLDRVGVGGGSFTLVIDDANFADERSTFIVTVTKLI